MYSSVFRLVDILFVLLLLVLIALGAAPSALAQSSPPVSLEYYREAVERAWQRLEAGEPLDAVRAELAPITQVRLRSGEVITVLPVLEDVVLRDVARERLALLRAELDAALAADPAPALAELDTLRAELGIGRLTWWDRLRDWWTAFWDRLLAPADTAPLQGPARLLAWLWALLGLALTVALVGLWLRDLLARWLREPTPSPTHADGTPLPASADQARQEAAAQAQAGNYREAVRLLYLAALLHLAESGLLHFDPSLTNWEVLDQVPRDAPWRTHLEPVVAVFDRVWYGVREPDPETFHRYQEAIQALMQATAPEETSHGPVHA